MRYCWPSYVPTQNLDSSLETTVCHSRSTVVVLCRLLSVTSWLRRHSVLSKTSCLSANSSHRNMHSIFRKSLVCKRLYWQVGVMLFLEPRILYEDLSVLRFFAKALYLSPFSHPGTTPDCCHYRHYLLSDSLS